MTDCFKCKLQVTHSLNFLFYFLFAFIVCVVSSSCTDDEEDEFDLFVSNKNGIWESNDGTFKMEYSSILVVTDNGEISKGALNELGVVSGDIRFGILFHISGDYTYSFKVNKMKSATKMEVTVRCYKRETEILLYEKSMILNKVSEIDDK